MRLLAEPPAVARPVELFNGKDLAGWVNIYGTPDAWTVRNGILV